MTTGTSLINWGTFLTSADLSNILATFMAVIPIVAPVVFSLIAFRLGWRFVRGNVR